MKISAKQLQQLLYFCHGFTLQGSMLTDDGRKDLKILLAAINKQQSEELKEIGE